MEPCTRIAALIDKALSCIELTRGERHELLAFYRDNPREPVDPNLYIKLIAGPEAMIKNWEE